MARRVRREYVDEGDTVVEDNRPFYFNPVTALFGLVLLALLVWALIWGPIGEMFDDDGEGPRIDTPTVNNR